ncbi:hypothetical protein SDC9_132983 [bioreactor metagenome]|uniref:Uncharacterized protein n=1 Tax=bioreactor metagenome TaxID=1076179 RepID=A0A645D8N2_9ZZZZ
MYPSPWGDWCKDEFLPWIDDQYNIARRVVDDTGIVRFWRLRSPGANRYRIAFVSGFCGDGFDQGVIDISGCSGLIDGHFEFDSFGSLSNGLEDEHCINGIRPALWLKTC